MITNPIIAMSHGLSIVAQYKDGVNDNMCHSHYHDFFELYFLESGTRHTIIQNNLYTLKAGEFAIFPPRVMHHSYGDANVPFKRILIYFWPNTISSERVLQYFSHSTSVFSVDSTERSSIHRLMEMIYAEQESNGLCSQEYINTLLNLLLLIIMRRTQKIEETTSNNVITDVIQYIHEHYWEDLTINHLSQHFFLSSYYLCRKFKKTTGNTIIQYLNTTRILNAQKMMLETDKNFTQISKETGFSNLTHFNRVFKNVTGMTPSENKRRNKDFITTTFSKEQQVDSALKLSTSFLKT